DMEVEQADVGGGVAERGDVAMDWRLGDGELLNGHVDPDHLAFRSGELRDEINVAARTRAEIKHAGALERRRHDDAAAIIFCAHLLMHIGEQRLEMSRHAAYFATRRSFQILRSL